MGGSTHFLREKPWARGCLGRPSDWTESIQHVRIVKREKPWGRGWIVYSVANYRPHLSHFWANMYFSRSQLSHFLFLWIDPFLDWMKNTLLFICSTNILVRLLTVNMKNCLTPNNPKMCDPIVVTLLKMRPHNSQSGRENATPSSDTSPLASCKKRKKNAKKKKRKCDCRCHSDMCIPVHIPLVICVSPTPRSYKQVSI